MLKNLKTSKHNYLIPKKMAFVNFDSIEYHVTNEVKQLIIKNNGTAISEYPFSLTGAYGLTLKVIKCDTDMKIEVTTPTRFPSLPYNLTSEMINNNNNAENLIFGNCSFDGSTESNIYVARSYASPANDEQATIGHDGLFHLMFIGTNDLRDGRNANDLQHVYLMEPTDDTPRLGYHLNLKVESTGSGNYDLKLRYGTFNYDCEDCEDCE